MNEYGYETSTEDGWREGKDGMDEMRFQQLCLFYCIFTL